MLYQYKRNERGCARSRRKERYPSAHSDLQGFLLALLDDVEQYFKATPPLAEEKLYASLNTIFTRIARDFPLVSSVANLNKRIARDLRDKVSDVNLN